jgi:thioredoxin reductase (NADPH)
MPQPVILVVADDGRVLDPLAGDLERRFGDDYRILAERSPTAAQATLERLAGGPDPVALVIAARRMRELDGLGLLGRVHELHPGARRVLLEHRGEWKSGEPVVHAMTLGQLDYLLYRPWRPLERNLYLPVSEFLAGWESSRTPTVEAIRIIGPRWGARSHQLREVLTRAGIPFGFYPDDSEGGKRLLEEVGEDASRLPILVFQGGLVLVDPSNAELGAALGLRTSPLPGGCDVLIVGAGPAGLACAIRLGQLLEDAPELRERLGEVPVAILEKGKQPGSHLLSGAVVNPRALRRLFKGRKRIDEILSTARSTTSPSTF